MPLPVFQVATRRLDPSLRSEILPEGQALTDQEADVFSIRYADDGRLITAYPAALGTGLEAGRAATSEVGNAQDGVDDLEPRQGHA